MNTQPQNQSTETAGKEKPAIRHFRIEKLEERIAPVGPRSGDNGQSHECRINPQGQVGHWCFTW